MCASSVRSQTIAFIPVESSRTNQVQNELNMCTQTHSVLDVWSQDTIQRTVKGDLSMTNVQESIQHAYIYITLKGMERKNNKLLNKGRVENT